MKERKKKLFGFNLFPYFCFVPLATAASTHRQSIEFLNEIPIHSMTDRKSINQILFLSLSSIFALEFYLFFNSFLSTINWYMISHNNSHYYKAKQWKTIISIIKREQHPEQQESKRWIQFFFLPYSIIIIIIV